MPHPWLWHIDQLPSPLGEMLLVTDQQGVLRALDWEEGRGSLLADLRKLYGNEQIKLTPGAIPKPMRDSLEAYWAGDLQALSAIIVDTTAGTPFQRAAWDWLRSIPAGETRSYKEQALGMNRPSAVRAVGHANSRNPIGIVVPCHRVIGANGTLTGYAGGVERKRWLLAHEGVDL
ncbi:cysteine methyltransferase [Acidithiobacillus marinus]|uniref:methylated-DNA--[protein]-cysteine S-methyltransferase n=1 Tax=Acidithiobacillus marinus TaxID=187490 RepID=A0A2I1DI81_9PROT|nr:methylated-DNA--[protein]-cysteine S-methyltransferase [Acidithiobacillus marinus]PKY09578.1 cysteine methyltransferase [Acidithiobacillus marinus]